MLSINQIKMTEICICIGILTFFLFTIFLQYEDQRFAWGDPTLLKIASECKLFNARMHSLSSSLDCFISLDATHPHKSMVEETVVLSSVSMICSNICSSVCAIQCLGREDIVSSCTGHFISMHLLEHVDVCITKTKPNPGIVVQYAHISNSFNLSIEGLINVSENVDNVVATVKRECSERLYWSSIWFVCKWF